MKKGLKWEWDEDEEDADNVACWSMATAWPCLTTLTSLDLRPHLFEKLGRGLKKNGITHRFALKKKIQFLYTVRPKAPYKGTTNINELYITVLKTIIKCNLHVEHCEFEKKKKKHFIFNYLLQRNGGSVFAYKWFLLWHSVICISVSVSYHKSH